MHKNRYKNRESPSESEKPLKRNIQFTSVRHELIVFLFRLGMLIILLEILFGVVFGITSMKNNDMAPRMSAGDLILYYRLETDIHNQDVIVFEKNEQQYVGRIIARGGDTVAITEEEQLILNGNLVTENQIYYTTPQYENEISYPVRLKEEEYFILCDYRESARDSRCFGAVKKSEIKGKVITVVRRTDL